MTHKTSDECFKEALDLVQPIHFADDAGQTMRRRFAEYLAKCCCGDRELIAELEAQNSRLGLIGVERATRLALAEAVATAYCVFSNSPPSFPSQRDQMLGDVRDAVVAWIEVLPSDHPARLEHEARLKMSTAQLAGIVRAAP